MCTYNISGMFVLEKQEIDRRNGRVVWYPLAEQREGRVVYKKNEATATTNYYYYY